MKKIPFVFFCLICLGLGEEILSQEYIYLNPQESAEIKLIKNAPPVPNFYLRVSGKWNVLQLHPGKLEYHIIKAYEDTMPLGVMPIHWNLNIRENTEKNSVLNYIKETNVKFNSTRRVILLKEKLEMKDDNSLIIDAYYVRELMGETPHIRYIDGIHCLLRGGNERNYIISSYISAPDLRSLDKYSMYYKCTVTVFT